MYKSLDVISVAERAAKAAVAKDREKYTKFLAEIEKFAEENKMTVGGEHATRLLLAEPDTGEGLGTIELYSPRAVDHAKKLAVALYKVDPEGLGHYATMLTKTPGNELVIVVNARELVKVVSVRTRTMPIQRRAMFYKPGRPFCMPPEIQLIQIYGALCDPSQASEWKKLLEEEEKLREMTLKGIRPKIARQKRGRGGQAPAIDESRIGAFVQLVAGDYARGARVLVGRSPTQFAAEDLSKERAAVTKLAEQARVAVSISEESCEIPMEPRLRRMSVTVVDTSGTGREVLRVFNAAAFELVPYSLEKDGRKVGNIFVKMRFALIEVMSVQLKMRTKELSEEVGRKALLKAVGKYEDADTEYAAVLKGKDAIDRLFPVNASFGKLESLDLARKRIIQEQTKKSAVRYPPFYPAKRAEQE